MRVSFRVKDFAKNRIKELYLNRFKETRNTVGYIDCSVIREKKNVQFYIELYGECCLVKYISQSSLQSCHSCCSRTQHWAQLVALRL